MTTDKATDFKPRSNGSLILAILLLAVGITESAAVSAASGDLYVSNFTFPNPVVVRYDGQSGDFVEVFASGGLITAAGLAFGPNGNLFVGSQTCCINEYDGVTGAFIRTFVSGIDTRGLVFGPDGDLYAADASRDSIRRYDGETGAFMGDFVAPGSGGLDFPQHLAFGLDGNLYVSGTRTTAVLRYDGMTGDFLGVAAPVGGPQHGIAFGSDGLLYVATLLTGEVQRFDGATGTFIDVVLNVREITEIDLFYSLAIVFGPGGDLFVSASDDPLETTPGFVLRYDGQTGTFLGVFAEGGVQGGGAQ